MTEAPERICTSQCGKTLVHDGMKRFETDVEYIRVNHVDALLKAEREKALREAAENLSVYAPSLVDGPEHDVGYYYGYTTALHRVLDLISEDKTDG